MAPPALPEDILLLVARFLRYDDLKPLRSLGSIRLYSAISARYETI
jgi:hypothetical protein